jgi:hypothetical protein
MALIHRSKTQYNFPLVWVDPDTTKNRVWIDGFAYNYTALAPNALDRFYWQTRNNVRNTSSTIDFDDYVPVQTGNLDGNTWTSSNNVAYACPGLFDNWILSLDYQNYKPTRNWRSAGGLTILTYPRTSNATQQYGDWWIGEDMVDRAQAYRTEDSAYYVHIYEQTENISFTAESWSYSGTTITVTKTNHGLYFGDVVTISGMTATTNAPQGTYFIATVPNNNSFTFTALLTPTGTAGGTVTVTGTTRRGWGLEHEGQRATYATSGMSVSIIQGYDNVYNDNDATVDTALKNTAARSRPYFDQKTLGGGWKFFLGIDSQYFWVVKTEAINNFDYSVLKYDMTSGTGTETTVLAATTVTTPLANVIPNIPSNLRHDSSSRKVFYSSHFNTTELAPLRLVWDKDSGTITSSVCTITYPDTYNFSTYSALPTANNFNSFGYNNWWIKAHQFTKNNTNYITFCTLDKYIYANSARFPTRKARTWLTFSVGGGTADNSLTFHSALTFETTNTFPMGWVPYNSTGTKLAIFNNIGSGIWEFNDTTFDADSWTYTTINNTLSRVVVTKTNHGLTVGTTITTAGTANTTTNSPIGQYIISEVISANEFVFIADANNTGVITGTATGTLNIRTGWQLNFQTSLRARGYGVDNSGRLWIGTRITGTGRMEAHVIGETVPATIDIKLSSPAANTFNKYIYTSGDENTNILVNVYDYMNNRVSKPVILTIKSNNVTFTGGATTIKITSSASQDTSVPIIVKSVGQTLITATAGV